MNQPTLDSQYSAASVETKWYHAWEEAGLFRPTGDPSRPLFTISIPPPNITGSLHMGHALCYPIQDLVGRYRRLRGDRVHIIPGQDHAGIATQSVVDKQLRKEGKSAAELGREAFVERVWQWRQESGSTILGQFRQLGCAFDWTCERFTLDEGYVRAVLTVFIEWFKKGLIYRGKRVVNWDPVLQTSVSDIETERKIVRGKLYHIRYPFADGSGEVVIATTRPETMLADVAVAVHPSDARYKGLIGKALILPLMNREIPLIEDVYPDPEFGTGAVKITPSHDANDFEVGVRHNLPMPVVIDPTGKMAGDVGKYAGLDRYECRKQVIADLNEGGYLVKIDEHEIPIIVGERSGEVIEPLLSEQWFVRQSELAKPAAQALRDGRFRFVPERYSKVYLDWMDNIRDWCISRQLWWGHRIPIYYTEDGTAYAALNWEDAQKQAGEAKIVRQDDDVLDTWFSSGLWPFAVMGWPDQTEALATEYPTSLLVTDRNIIYLWVARMVMMGLSFAGEIPFRDVYIHATVLTEDGRRMSKSLGTGVDPRGVIEEIGADALRWTLLSQSGMTQELRYSTRRTEDARNLCNKLWNASRFLMMNCDGVPGPVDYAQTSTLDKWILNRLAVTEKAVRTAYDSYDIQAASTALYAFFWSDFCDWYIEASKPRLNDPATRALTQSVLMTCLHSLLLMMHPIMPHITEEIYQHLPVANKAQFLMSAAWPELPNEFANDSAGETVASWFEMIRAVRALRAEIGLGALKDKLDLHYVGDVRGGEAMIQALAGLQSLKPGLPEAKHVSTTMAGVDFHLPIEGVLDTEKELGRLQREFDKLNAEMVKLQARLENPQFVERAKPEVVEREKAAYAEMADRLGKLTERIQLFS